MPASPRLRCCSQRWVRAARAVAAASLGLTLIWVAATGIGAPATSAPATPPASTSTPTNTRVPPAELNRSIDEVLARREFAWRERRAAAADTKESWLRRFFRWLGDLFERWERWWRKLFPKRRVVINEPTLPSGPGLSFLALKPLAYTTGAILLLVTVFYLVKALLDARRARAALAGRAAPAGSGAAAPDADLTDENLLANQLPEDDWLRLARELLARGERRLALRAFYLSTLALLAGRGLVGIARHKTNGDYLGEVRRRAGRRAAAAAENPPLPATFEHMVRSFERSWYGRHEAGDEAVAALLTDREAITAELSAETPPPAPAPPPPPPTATTTPMSSASSSS